MSIFDQLFFQSAASGNRKRQISRMLTQLNENERSDRAQFPEDGARWQPFLASLRETIGQYESFEQGKPVDASVQVFLTEDRMYAYACLLPPLDGGAEFQLFSLGKELERQGVSIGLEESAFSFVMKRQYLHIFPVARGTFPEDGTDGALTELFEHRPVYTLDVRDGETPDFQQVCPIQLVQKGDPVFRVRPATPGKQGVDVTGRILPCRAGVPVNIPAGLNLELSADGLRVEASENGAVFDIEGSLYVQTAIIRRGSLQQNDNLVWLAYIEGDIPKGIRVVSTSGILVMGEIRGAEVISRGTVRAQRGIWEGSKVEAKGQVVAPVIESSQVRADRSIFAEEIRDSDITCGGGVFVKTGKGLIQGGTVRAVEGVECVQVGDPDGGQNEFQLGYPLELDEEIVRITKELEETKEIVYNLQRNLFHLRRDAGLFSSDQRGAAGRLAEQKDQYEEQKEELEARLQDAKEKRLSDRDRQLLCQRMYPATQVRIGKYTGNFSNPEKNCRVYLYSGIVVLTNPHEAGQS